MYALLRPDPEHLRRYIARESVRPVFDSPAVLPDPPPRGYHPNRAEIELGSGKEVFEAARSALGEWRQFPEAWAMLEPPRLPIAVGGTVAVVVRYFGVWVVTCCQITHVFDTERHFGFIYATTAGHPLAGAELFEVVWGADDRVVYRLHSYSITRQLTARLARGFVRGLQRRFALDSPAAMLAAVRSTCGAD
ncbi:MAG: DUF1990 domain-containing protein [Planctomycetaceae bacterium]